MADLKRNFSDAASKAAIKDERADIWLVYPHYKPSHPEGEAYAVASFPARAKRRKQVRAYAPLADTPDLFLKFARLADQEITRDVWLGWLHRYGVLGLERYGKSYNRAWMEGGGSEKFSRFREEAQTANGVLRLYEAATAPDGPDVAVIAEFIPERRRLYHTQTAEWAWWWALQEVGEAVQKKLMTECFPQLYLWKDGNFARAWGFGSLLGAMYLQMKFLMTSSETRRCKARDCERIIIYRQPESPPGIKKNDRSGGYRPRSDKEFCNDACSARERYWRRKEKAFRQ
jgi:hypothetical protein